MKLIKALGLTAIAAVAAMALIGAGTASATTLCKVKTNPCPEASRYPVGTEIVALSSKAVLTGTLNVTCHSEVTLKTEKNDGPKAKLLGKITALKWSNCSPCSPVVTKVLPTGSLLANGEGGGTLLTESLTEVWLENCPFAGTCVAKATDASLAFDGGTIGAAGTAQALANGVPVTLSGSFLCGTSGKWFANGAEGSTSYHVIKVGASTTGEVWATHEP